MKLDEFFKNCIGNPGGNWALWIMSGLKKVFPEVYQSLDNNKKYSFVDLMQLLEFLGVDSGEVEVDK